MTGDRIERGPGHWRLFRKDIDLAAERLRSNAFRFSVEWSRVFPRSTAGVRVGRRIDLGDLRRLDRLADHAALRHYAAELRVSNRRGLEPFVTVSHFALPSWIHDPIAVRDALAGRGPGRRAPADRPRRVAGQVDRARVPQVRRLPGVEARAPRDLLDAHERADGGGGQRLRERARSVRRLLPSGRVLVQRGDPRGHEPGAGQRGGLRRDPRLRPPGAGGPGAQHDRLHARRPGLGARPHAPPSTRTTCSTGST